MTRKRTWEGRRCCEGRIGAGLEVQNETAVGASYFYRSWTFWPSKLQPLGCTTLPLIRLKLALVERPKEMVVKENAPSATITIDPRKPQIMPPRAAPPPSRSRSVGLARNEKGDETNFFTYLVSWFGRSHARAPLGLRIFGMLVACCRCRREIRRRGIPRRV